MRTSLQIAASVVAFAALKSVSAVHVEVKYVTEMHTVTGQPPTHTPMPHGLQSESAEGKTLSPATIPASLVTPETPVSSTITPAASPASEGSSTSSSASKVSSASVSSLSSATSAASLVTSASLSASAATSGTSSASAVTQAPASGLGVMNIAIENHWSEPLSISYGDNEGLPGALGAPTAAPLGTSTNIAYPTGWAGRIYIGKTVNSADSKIEGSTTGANDIDVSYVDGFSVPITCSDADEVVTGCNIDLFSVGGNCTHMVGDRDVCLNPMQGVADGPSDPWFLPCQGAAYTFPNDNVANNGDTRTPDITCCIGTEAMGCKAPERQGKGNNKASKAKRGLHLSSLKPHTAAHAHSHLARHLNSARAHHHGFARHVKDAV